MEKRFRPLEHHLSFSLPDRLTEVDGWHQHIPFAMALVSMLRPRVVVELGTHRGDSYSAMCQAVAALALETRCYAVDTWSGDEHSGKYGEEVLQELREYHDPRYGRFSTLLRASFDEALGHFQDGEVDLLHVDGLHSFEAVQHDFESWRPKLSRRAVALFHDTNVRERDFGVWRFWVEASRGYPSFEFAHGHGLGVLAVGPDVPGEILDLCSLGAEERLAMARLFEALGERVVQFGKLRSMRHECQRLRRLEPDAARVPSLESALAASDERVRELEADAAFLREFVARRVRNEAPPLGLSWVWRRLGFGSEANGAMSRRSARRYRSRELRRLKESGLFDVAWYASKNQDVAAAGVDPLAHYYDIGAAEGRDPNPWFDTSWYVANVPEVAATGVNPLVHYLERGAREMRDPHPRFSAARYLAAHPEVEREGLNPLVHFLRTDASRSR
jgi:hypothetical protein